MALASLLLILHKTDEHTSQTQPLTTRSPPLGSPHRCCSKNHRPVANLIQPHMHYTPPHRQPIQSASSSQAPWRMNTKLNHHSYEHFIQTTSSLLDQQPITTHLNALFFPPTTPFSEHSIYRVSGAWAKQSPTKTVKPPLSQCRLAQPITKII